MTDNLDDAARAGYEACVRAHRLGALAELMATAPDVLTRLSGSPLQNERRDLLRLYALAACETARYDIALAASHELAVITTQLGEPGPCLLAALVLASCLDRMGDAWQAHRVLTEALGQHGPFAPERERMLALNGLCAIAIGLFHLTRQTVSAAETRAVLVRARGHGMAARELLAVVPEPVYEVVIYGNCGEILLHLGELEEAKRLLDAGLQRAHERELHAHRWRIACSMGEWLLASGRPGDAALLINGLLPDLQASDLQTTLLRARQTLYRAARARGLFEEALQHFEAAELLERSRSAQQLQAQSQLFVTRIEAEQARIDAQQQRARAAEFAQTAERDALTGLGNRRHLARRCAELLPQAEQMQKPLALALIDVDHFKPINDTHGHAAGDQVLVTLAQVLRENMRTGDVVARVGGEEFVVVLPDTTQERAAEVCERLRERVARHDWHPLKPGTEVTISIGLCAAGPYDLAILQARADHALYGAKARGRNQLCVAGAQER